MSGSKESCKCAKCRKVCKFKPGWFKPDQMNDVADYFDTTLAIVFYKYLAVDWWSAKEPIFILAPVIKTQKSGSEYPPDGLGECCFYLDGLCSIHEVKPYECRQMLHDHVEENKNTHKEVSEMWDEPKHQELIKDLLGRKPEASASYIKVPRRLL